MQLDLLKVSFNFTNSVSVKNDVVFRNREFVTVTSTFTGAVLSPGKPISVVFPGISFILSKPPGDNISERLTSPIGISDPEVPIRVLQSRA